MESKSVGLAQHQKVAELMREKLELLREYYRLTEIMSRGLTFEGMVEFNELIEERKQLIDGINGLDSELLTYETKISTPSNEIKQLKMEIKECLVQIREIDQKVQQELKQNYNNIVKSMCTLRVNRQAMAKYHKKSNQSQAFFVDKKK